MNFPIENTITASTSDFPTANVLRVEGNAGLIPPSFQYTLLKRDGGDVILKQGVSQLTDAQWDAWTQQPARAYVPSCLAENLGVVLA